MLSQRLPQFVIVDSSHAPVNPRAEDAAPDSPAPEQDTTAARWRVVVSLLLIVMVIGLLGRIGADAHWLVALGQRIWTSGGLPRGVPFATAPTANWANPLGLGELAFYGLHQLGGDRGLLTTSLLAAAVALAVVSADAQRGGASASGAAVSIAVVALGALPDLAITRVQLFSVALFPLMLWLLRSEHRQPSRRVWLAPLLLLVWANLHAGALVGALVTGIYLVLARARSTPRTALGVGLASAVAVCGTSALLSTPSYYLGVLSNRAAQRGLGLWTRLSFHSVSDLLLLAAAAALAVMAIRQRRMAIWEVVAALVLAGLTVRTSRSGLWLLLLLAAPAASQLAARRRWGLLLALGLIVSLCGIGWTLARGPLAGGASDRLLRAAMLRSAGTAILADDVDAEEIAVLGGKVPVANPIDAFSRRDQDLYLDWLSGRRDGLAALGRGLRVAVVARGSSAATLIQNSREFRLYDGDQRSLLFLRSP